jgi:hypothetical protein
VGLTSSISACLPRLAKNPPADPGSIHEIKHDGFRIMARRDGASARLITRKGNDFRGVFRTAVRGASHSTCNCWAAHRSSDCHHHAAVGAHRRAGNCARFARTEEGDHFGNLFRRGQPFDDRTRPLVVDEGALRLRVVD